MIDVSPELLGNYCYMIKNLIFRVVAIAQIGTTVKLETLASGNIGEFGESGSNRQTLTY